MYRAFNSQIVAMNNVYELAPVNYADKVAILTRLQQFDIILRNECGEIGELLGDAGGADTYEDRLRVRVGIADLLADLIVYCSSEAVRWNIPLDQVLAVVMSSNFSKLGADGKPIKDENDKFQKGPGYWKPEPVISAILSNNFAIDTTIETHLGGLIYTYVGRETAAIAAAATQTDPPDSGSQKEVHRP
jgi:hypothetical protein